VQNPSPDAKAVLGIEPQGFMRGASGVHGLLYDRTRHSVKDATLPAFPESGKELGVIAIRPEVQEQHPIRDLRVDRFVITRSNAPFVTKCSWYIGVVEHAVKATVIRAGGLPRVPVTDRQENTRFISETAKLLALDD
jgi:hypothetical protein